MRQRIWKLVPALVLTCFAVSAPASSAINCQAQYDACMVGCSVGTPCWQACSRQYLLCTQGI